MPGESRGHMRDVPDGVRGRMPDLPGEPRGRMPRALALSLVIGPACWLMPHQGAIATLLPQRIAAIDPEHKVTLVMMFSTVAMLVALVANIVLGACSDRTRTRFGKRKPWIVGCSVLSCLVLAAFARADGILAMLAWWCLYELVVNGVASAMVAQLSDRVPAGWRGTLSSAYGLGQTIGGQAGTLVAAQFLGDVTLGVDVFAAVALAGGVVSALLAGERSNLDEPARPFSARDLASMVMFPTHGARDFYKTLAARFLLVVGGSMASNYMLYILQDYLRLGREDAQRLLSVNSAITLVIGLACCLAAGPVTDRIGRPKLLVVCTTAMIAVGALVPFLCPTPGGLIAFSCIVGVASGANSSLVQTISVEVLPDASAAAKDLGVLNLANTLGGVGASLVAASVIGRFGYGAVFAAQAVIVLCSGALFLSIRRLR